MLSRLRVALPLIICFGVLPVNVAMEFGLLKIIPALMVVGILTVIWMPQQSYLLLKSIMKAVEFVMSTLLMVTFIIVTIALIH